MSTIEAAEELGNVELDIAEVGIAETGGEASVEAGAVSPRRGSPVPAVELRAAHVSAARGAVFGPLTATSTSPVTVVLGARGSGRTSLLLSIAGRMKLSGGSLETLGETKLSEIRRITGLVGFDGIDALEPSVTLGATLRERLGWALPWYRRTPRITPELSGELLAEAFGEFEQPDPAILVRELGPAEEMLVRVALALIEGPELLVVDDFDALRDPAERALVAERLSSLARRGIRIVVATTDPGDAALFTSAAPAAARGSASDAAPTVIEL
ncbi:ATP-binding cassette domain-containing protein [Leucobacter tenebrionis]|uniref:ATP-binding cassette domain-containing protein n=1 Tax=Leucobacter tenebrionis TaxID=2873270 RepID=UPI001CA6BCFA|nr:ATP-binding cassette domain-containing protein [Leucobacter tenebrionis]QZY51113.1 hypothetical protein KVY00_10905 [Leucobacter tenebrionis]